MKTRGVTTLIAIINVDRVSSSLFTIHTFKRAQDTGPRQGQYYSTAILEYSSISQLVNYPLKKNIKKTPTLLKITPTM